MGKQAKTRAQRSNRTGNTQHPGMSESLAQISVGVIMASIEANHLKLCDEFGLDEKFKRFLSEIFAILKPLNVCIHQFGMKFNTIAPNLEYFKELSGIIDVVKNYSYELTILKEYTTLQISKTTARLKIAGMPRQVALTEMDEFIEERYFQMQYLLHDFVSHECDEAGLQNLLRCKEFDIADEMLLPIFSDSAAKPVLIAPLKHVKRANDNSGSDTE